MAKEKGVWLDEDNTCLNCGESDYQPSKTNGLCIECNPISAKKNPQPNQR